VAGREIKHFTDLRVWRKAHGLFLDLLGDIEAFPTTRAAGILAEQLVRSCSSISANVAEGFNRSRRKFANCLDIAIGEANETENWLYKARDAGMMPGQTARDRLRTTIQVEKMLAGLRRKILANKDAVREDEAEYVKEDGPTSGA